MTKAYWCVTYISIENLEKLKKYAEVVTPVIKSFGGQALVRGGKYQALGDNFIRTVICEFPSYQKAMECHESKKYQEGWSLASEMTSRNLLIIEAVLLLSFLFFKLI